MRKVNVFFINGKKIHVFYLSKFNRVLNNFNKMKAIVFIKVGHIHIIN